MGITRNRKELTALIIGMLLCCTAMSQSAGTPLLTLHSDGGTLTLAFFWEGPTIVTIDGHDFSAIKAEGMSFNNGTPGKPDLPTISTVVQLPYGSRLMLSEVAGNETIWDGEIPTDKPIAPATGAHPKDGDRPPFNPDHKTYTTDAYHRGGDPVEVEHIGTMRHSEVYRITVRPLAYNHVRGSMMFYRSLRATMETTPGDEMPPTLQQPDRYLIVSRPEFQNGLAHFVEWKRHEGFEVVEIYAETNQRSTIKSLIATHFAPESIAHWPKYILLVGDVAQIQSFPGTTRPTGFDNHTTDLYYAEHTGDYLPDAMLGRWPVNDTAELRAVVEKTLRYEQSINLDTNQLTRALLVAGRENTQPAPTTTNGQVNYVKHRLVATHPGMDTTCHYNPTSGDQRGEILGEIAAGTAFVNFTAHCTVGGWDNPTVGYNSIDTLGESQPTLYINNCCKSNSFDGTGFGELLLRKPTGGAIGVIGATNSTLWNEDYYWSVGPKYPFSTSPAYDSTLPGAFDLWLGAKSQTLGALTEAGNMSVTAFGSPYDKFYWEIYCLLGDPSLITHLGAPQQNSLWIPDTIAVGTTALRISGRPGATVSAVQGDRLIGVVELDEHRSTEMILFQPVDTLPVVFTVTGANLMPLADTAYAVMPQGRAATFRNVTVGDTAVDFSLVNIGTDTLFNLSTLAECDDTTLAVFSTQPICVDTLEPGADTDIHLTLNILHWERWWRGLLKVADSTVACNPLRISGETSGIPPTLSFALLDADSNDAHTLTPNTAYLLAVNASGLHDSAWATVTALPNGDTLSQSTQTLIPFSTPDTITHLHIAGSVQRGNYTKDYDHWIVSGGRMDSFEEGTASYPWDCSSLHHWVLDSTTHHSGHFSLRSAPIDYRQTSELTLRLLLPADDSISFWCKVSSEFSYDKYTFSIDGVKRAELSGETDWVRCAYHLAAGNHTLKWRYIKDESGSTGSDCAWIDDVRLPLVLWDSAYGWFGSTETSGPESIDSTALPKAMKIYPNPAHNEVWLECDTHAEAEIHDMLGRTIGQLLIEPGRATHYSMGQLPAGVYYIVTHSCGATYRNKIIKQ